MSSTTRKRTSKGKNLPRWTTEEIEFLEARFHMPFKAVFQEYRKAGYRRTERAVSVKYYALKKAGKTMRRDQGDGVQRVALELAATYDVVTLQAAVQIREVLERVT